MKGDCSRLSEGECGVPEMAVLAKMLVEVPQVGWCGVIAETDSMVRVAGLGCCSDDDSDDCVGDIYYGSGVGGLLGLVVDAVAAVAAKSIVAVMPMMAIVRRRL